jgi:hypothetical protein
MYGNLRTGDFFALVGYDLIFCLAGIAKHILESMFFYIFTGE